MATTLARACTAGGWEAHAPPCPVTLGSVPQLGKTARCIAEDQPNGPAESTIDQVKAIRAALEGDSESAVQHVIHLRTLHLGPEELLVAAKLAVGAQDTGEQISAAINAAEKRAREAAPALSLVLYLEPDIDRGDFDPVSWQRPSD